MLVLNYYFNYVKCKNDKKGTFLCLHDFQSNQNTFNGIIESISEEYDYYSLNLPGHSIQEKNLLTKKEFQDQLNVESIVNFIIAFISAAFKILEDKRFNNIRSFFWSYFSYFSTN